MFGKGIGIVLAAALGSMASISEQGESLTEDVSVRRKYQRMRPITNKNIGRNLLKGGSRYMPHQGERECARRRRQMASGQLTGRIESNG